MKTMLLLITLLVMLARTAVAVIIPGQPSGVGISDNYSWVTLFEDSRRFGLSCAHFYPSVGATIYFGNGSTGKVKSVKEIRGGYYNNFEYDISLVEMEEPVNVVPVKTYWQKPTDAGFVQNEIVVDGFGKNGWYKGTQGFMKTNPIELYNGLWFTSPWGTIGNGDSGSPLFYKGALIGIVWGSRSGGAGGATNTIWQVFGQYWYALPMQFHPPLEPSWAFTKTEEGHVKVRLKQPPFQGLRIETMCGTTTYKWENPTQQPQCCGYEEASTAPWESHVVWDSPHGIFRGQSP